MEVSDWTKHTENLHKRNFSWTVRREVSYEASHISVCPIKNLNYTIKQMTVWITEQYTKFGMAKH